MAQRNPGLKNFKNGNHLEHGKRADCNTHCTPTDSLTCLCHQELRTSKLREKAHDSIKPNPKLKSTSAENLPPDQATTSTTAATDQYNVEAAEILASSAQHLPIAQAAPIYEQLVSLFPTAAKFWKQYAEAHMAVNNDDAIKQIFSRRCYIRFIRKVNEKKGAEGQEETRKAFEFMLGCVGVLSPWADIASGPAHNAQEESIRMTAIRKTYQKAIVTPTHHVEQLWRDYENFENSVSRHLAKGLLSEYQPKYNSARAVYREQKKYVDEIDWNMLAVPPTGSYKCLMYLYHYPDAWYDYATWHAKSGSIDAAIKVFQRALKALPDSEMLKYAYAELEESRGAIQPAKKIYESLLGDGVNTTALAHIQFIRFLRRNEGVEAARKYFLDVRKSTNCTYHVYVAYALMAFCLDKDPKIAHNIFEAGLKHFMHEPVYILEYADFLSRLNDDRNIRALFERALSSLPPEESVEVWKRYTQFEQTYGDLASMLKPFCPNVVIGEEKIIHQEDLEGVDITWEQGLSECTFPTNYMGMRVEQRRKEALSRTVEDGASAFECSLQDVVSRYNFMDLWPCSSKDLDHLARQEDILPSEIQFSIFVAGSETSLLQWLAKNISKKVEKAAVSYGPGTVDKGPAGLTSNSNASGKVIYPDTSQTVIYDSRQNLDAGIPPSTTASGFKAASNTLSNSIGLATDGFDEILKATPPALISFLANLPIVEGPTPNVDIVLSICLQSDVPIGQTGKSRTALSPMPSGAAPATSDLSGSSKSRPVPSGSSFKTRDRQSGKRKERARQEEDETVTVQSQPLPRDVFRIRQIQKSRAGTTSQTGSASYGSALSGDLSGYSGSTG
ncbi:unnamed protein product [Dovyalis caffra]|uniref:Suppressor of forked domain-containing protein n=1 Tax=Dovyalis caffra TaxID=77055 RepID=A0AAV1SQQ1_9ROSI|nr:unnamed protein product [Dovyalis caffra]